MLAGSAAAQSDRVKLVFMENGKPLEVCDLAVDIVSIQTGKVLLSLSTSKDGVLVHPELATLGEFNAHISFSQYKLIVPNIDRDYFDNEWIIDVIEVLPQKGFPTENIANCGKLLRTFRVVFRPSKEEGFWWLIGDCSPSKE